MEDPRLGLGDPAALVEVAAGKPLALLVDIDNFLWLNDQFGHTAGDAALLTLAGLLGRFGAAFRIGGDEILVVLPAGEVSVALQTAGEIVTVVRAAAIPYRRLDRPHRTCLEVNVTLIRLTPALVAGGVRGPAMARLKDEASGLAYARKQETGGEPGVVVDAHLARFDG